MDEGLHEGQEPVRSQRRGEQVILADDRYAIILPEW